MPGTPSVCVFVCMRRSISRLSRSSKSERSSTSGDPFAAAPVRGPSPRGPLTRTVSRFSADPDRAHDKKVAGLPIDPAVTAAKLSLRRLRDAVDTTASFYSKYAERKRGAASGNLPLLLPDLAEWSRHEAFCGDEESRRALHTCAAQLAAIDDLLAAEHAAIGRAAAGLRGEARRLCEEGLDAVCAFELALRDASAASEAATKALRRGAAAGEAAKADGRKAAALKDEKRRQAAQAAAQRAQERSDADVVQAEGAVRRAEELLARQPRSGISPHISPDLVPRSGIRIPVSQPALERTRTPLHPAAFRCTHRPPLRCLPCVALYTLHTPVSTPSCRRIQRVGSACLRRTARRLARRCGGSSARGGRAGGLGGGGSARCVRLRLPRRRSMRSHT